MKTKEYLNDGHFGIRSMGPIIYGHPTVPVSGYLNNSFLKTDLSIDF